VTGLFDRLGVKATANVQSSRREARGRKFEVIKQHLETLLNCREGCSQSSPELGLRDFNGHDLSRGDLLQQVSADIRHTIDRFEPRIAVHALQAVPDAHAPLELHFHLDCQVQVNNHAEQLQIELLVSGHSRYTRVK
jgi:type VI secretion system protein